MDKRDFYKKIIGKSFFSDTLGDSLKSIEDKISFVSSEFDRINQDAQKGLIRERHVLVIGGAGYIGSVLSANLLGRGYKVRVLDCLLWNNGSSIYDLLDHPDFSFQYGDFRNLGDVQKALDGITDVVLLAALVGDPVCKKYSDLARSVNREGTVELIKFLNEKNIHQFIFASTCSNYGLRDNNDPAPEDSDLNPQSLYAETKIEVEQFIMNHFEGMDFHPTILRFSTAYGLSRRMRYDLTINEFCRELVVNKELLVYDENTWRPYCHTQDFSTAIIKVLESPASAIRGQVFNVGSNEENYTKKTIVDAVASYLNTDLNINYKSGGHDPRNYKVSFDKIRNTLNFTNKYNLQSTIPTLVGAIQNGLFNDVDSRKTFYGNYEVLAKLDTV